MSKPTSQCQAVINAVTNILGDEFTESETNAKEFLSSDHLSTIADEVTSGIFAGTVGFGGPTEDEGKVRSYVVSMISNHLRKSKKLNGGMKYESNGTGRGSRDTVLSNLQRLIKNYEEGTDEFTTVADAILERKSVLEVERSAKSEQRKKKKMGS